MNQKKVLIVDDMVDLAETLKDLVTFKGHTALVAYNGLDALELAFHEHPDLILLDVRMPEMDGFEVMRRIRQDAWGKNAKIVFLTASASADQIPQDLTVKPEDFLTKSQWGVDNPAGKIEEKLAEASEVA